MLVDEGPSRRGVGKRFQLDFQARDLCQPRGRDLRLVLEDEDHVGESSADCRSRSISPATLSLGGNLVRGVGSSPLPPLPFVGSQEESVFGFPVLHEKPEVLELG